MQQLMIGQWHPVDKNFQAHIVSHQTHFPSQQEFVSWVNHKVEMSSLKLIDLSTGSDRAQAHVVFKKSDFTICFDGTCEAIWLEPVGGIRQTDLDSILVKLTR
ncbi:hypothetical protein [Aliiglaciecola sp. M165]|uniref:hypothetical protein n=1 Tax=Aliiglaciecola sp. M165 TaxID=2593649 RepID=UPI00118089D0|nr:hypothetical protein [Aliiglaciecola sp. M165]TRY33986.1 hypothetical protein FM019_01650 [Aliiglaciecola sp. M165]